MPLSGACCSAVVEHMSLKKQTDKLKHIQTLFILFMFILLIKMEKKVLTIKINKLKFALLQSHHNF